MATISISGTNKLAERIVTDAQDEARVVLEDAQEVVQETQRESDKTLSARSTELKSQREAAMKSLVGGYQTRASLDAKKDALRKKRVVIDAAFTRAYDAVLSLDGETRKAVCARMIKEYAEGGEMVSPAKADRAALAAIIAEQPEKKLTLSKDDAAIDGGFILLGKGYEKDCSFRSLLDTVRDAEETAVYQLLFD
ncbi:MAG: hypothetical protein VB061_05165 [Christensenella sp.]|nr:hypothetical protein [Christensenella sp.]